MTASAAIPATAPSDLAWRVIGLVNLYRLLVPLVLLALQYLAGLAVCAGLEPPAAPAHGLRRRISSWAC